MAKRETKFVISKLVILEKRLVLEVSFSQCVWPSCVRTKKNFNEFETIRQNMIMKNLQKIEIIIEILSFYSFSL